MLRWEIADRLNPQRAGLRYSTLKEANSELEFIEASDRFQNDRYFVRQVAPKEPPKQARSVGAGVWVVVGLLAFGALIVKDHIDQENQARRSEELTASCEAAWTDADLTIPTNPFDTPEFSSESMRHDLFISQCERVGPENVNPEDYEDGLPGGTYDDGGYECQSLQDCPANEYPGEEGPLEEPPYEP